MLKNETEPGATVYYPPLIDEANKNDIPDISSPKEKVLQKESFSDWFKMIVYIIIIIAWFGVLAAVFLPMLVNFVASEYKGIISLIFIGLIVLGGFAFLGSGIEAIFKTNTARVPSYSERYPDNWIEIRHEVLTKDGNRCANCGSKENLHIHHIVPLKDHGSNSIDNLKTVCKKCHKKIHPFMKDYD